MKRDNSKALRYFRWATTFVFLLTTMNACIGTSGRSEMAASQSQQFTSFGKWTWVSGDKKVDQRGVYGTQGIADSENKPGARKGAIGWTDREDNLWLFGGMGFTDKRNLTYLNDMWKFEGTNWIWVFGDKTGREKGVYSTKGIPAASNKPGSRVGAVSWTDAEGNLWLFGGEGYARNNYTQLLDDLWKFDGREWTWVSGDCMKGRPGVYGNLGVPESSNQPGARVGAISWTDPQGNLWLFGGNGYDRHGTQGSLSDLWKFDGTNWIWVSGYSMCNYGGVYGEQGVAAVANKPGAREDAASWTDTKGNLWLFGGVGVDEFGRYGYLNDIWKFDGKNWTWISGDKETDNKLPHFSSEPTDFPSGRYGALCWSDNSGNLWLFGGYATTKTYIMSNALWIFDGRNWVRVFVATTHKERLGIYDTQGVASNANIPGSRAYAVSWVDSEGNFWLFGGDGVGGVRNDLWKFEPQENKITTDNFVVSGTVWLEIKNSP